MTKKLFVGVASSVLLAGILGVSAHAAQDDRIVQHINMYNDSNIVTNTRNDKVAQYEKRNNDKIVLHQNLHNDRKSETNEKTHTDNTAKNKKTYSDKIMKHEDLHTN